MAKSKPIIWRKSEERSRYDIAFTGSFADLAYILHFSKKELEEVRNVCDEILKGKCSESSTELLRKMRCSTEKLNDLNKKNR